MIVNKNEKTEKNELKEESKAITFHDIEHLQQYPITPETSQFNKFTA